MSANDLITPVSTTGQVILPKVIRDLLRWDAGTRWMVKNTGDGVLLKAVTIGFVPTRPEDLFGCLPYKGPPKSIEQMDAAVAAEAKNALCARSILTSSSAT